MPLRIPGTMRKNPNSMVWMIALFSMIPAGWKVCCAQEAASKSLKGLHSYEAFDSSEKCAMCHKQIHAQYQKSAMAQAQVLPWDQAEYFKFALPHTKIEPKVAPVEAGCINCHAPQALLAGDIPPPVAGKANPKADGVSCDLCHSITGLDGTEPVNGNFIVKPGKIKYGTRKDAKSMGHEVQHSAFHESAKLCGTCHNESSPYGALVKETYTEWSNSRYAAANVRCVNCHVPPAPGKAGIGGAERADVAQHLFQGAYSQSMLNGAAVLHVYPGSGKVSPGSEFEITVVVTNTRAGHSIPTGSAEERQLWLHLEARNAQGKIYAIQASLAPKDTPENSYSVTTNKPSYRDLGTMMGLRDFKGISRDSLPEGDRLFRKVYLNPEGEETVAQWYAAKTDVFDNRLKPFEAVAEKYEWKVPADIGKGPWTITATLQYRRLPQSVADLAGIGEVPVLNVARDQAIVEVK